MLVEDQRDFAKAAPQYYVRLNPHCSQKNVFWNGIINKMMTSFVWLWVFGLFFLGWGLLFGVFLGGRGEGVPKSKSNLFHYDNLLYQRKDIRADLLCTWSIMCLTGMLT